MLTKPLEDAQDMVGISMQTISAPTEKGEPMAEYIENTGIQYDVVVVVRCCYCKWWDDSRCTNINGAFCVVENGDWFCADGERKGDDA